MTTTSQALKQTRRINTALMQVRDSFGLADPNIDDYSFIGGIRDVSIELSSTENEQDPSGDCLFGETSSEPEWEATFLLLADKSPWFIRNFLTPSSSNITTGAVVNITGEVIDLDYSVGENTYLAVVNNQDWDIDTTGGYVQNMANVTKTLDAATGATVSTALVLGTDYTLTQLNGFTAIHSVDGGALAKGDQITLDYDYTPANQVEIVFEGEVLLDTHTVRFMEDVNITGGVDKIREVIEFTSGEFAQNFAFAYKNCTDRDSIEPSEVTLRNASGTAVRVLNQWT